MVEDDAAHKAVAFDVHGSGHGRDRTRPRSTDSRGPIRSRASSIPGVSSVISAPRRLLAVLTVGLVATGSCASVPDVDDEVGPISSLAPEGGAAAAASTPADSGASVATSSTTEPSAARPIDPLTGLDSELNLERPALVIKIDNHDRARPQFGLNQADLVFEEIVEGGLTRFAAVFHSTDADPVGPIRSVRTSDFGVLANLSTPLFANSGGNDNVLALLGEVASVDVSSNAAGSAYYRMDGRPAPHNLLSDTEALWAAGATRGAAGAPPQLLRYRPPGPATSVGALEGVGVAIEYGATSVEYVWDPELNGWARSQNGSPHVDAAEIAVAPVNVIVQVIAYGRTADGRSPEAQLLGEGPAWFLVDGQVEEGTWSRFDSAEPTTYLRSDGSPMEFSPGATWVALPRVGQVTVLG